MRQIKFRIWDKQRKGWLSPDDSSLHCQSNWFIDPFTGKVVDVVARPDNQYSIDEDPEFYMNGIKIIKESRFVVQQFTGLTDKNGKDVYEGDILERITPSGSFAKVLVRWYDKECCFVYNNVHNLHGEPNPLHDNFVNLCDWTYWVVCGNIFENPELLE
jgi:hypothetical protein